MEKEVIKKSRALPRVWTRFWRMKKGDQFYVGKRLFRKVGWFDSCEVHPRSAVADYKFVWPWEHVRTTVLVRDVYIGGKGDSTNLPAFAQAMPTRPAFDQPRVDALPPGISCSRNADGSRADGFPEGFTRGGHDLMSPEEVQAYNERSGPSC